MEWLNYHHLLYFWTAAREGSITRAAERLLGAQPTVSGQIKRLEERIGEDLFVRQGRELVLTETGHLVFSTLHTVDASQTVERIIDMYPAGQQNQIRSMLANTLQAVVSQTLFSRIDRSGMVPAIEIMLCTPAIRNIIREARTFEIPNVIDTNRQLGMIGLDTAIAELFYNGMISREDAIAQSANPDKLERMIAA